jgi:hypothetical protein
VQEPTPDAWHIGGLFLRRKDGLVIFAADPPIRLALRRGASPPPEDISMTTATTSSVPPYVREDAVQRGDAADFRDRVDAIAQLATALAEGRARAAVECLSAQVAAAYIPGGRR